MYVPESWTEYPQYVQPVFLHTFNAIFNFLLCLKPCSFKVIRETCLSIFLLINVHSNQITFIFCRNFKFYLIWHNICLRIFWKCKKYKIPRGVRTLDLLNRNNTLNPLHYADRDDWEEILKLYFILLLISIESTVTKYQTKLNGLFFSSLSYKSQNDLHVHVYYLCYINIIIDDVFSTNFFFYFLQLLDHV